MPSIRSALGAGLIAIAVLLAPMGFTPTGGVSIGAGATVAAADGGPKVVIIVGPAGSASDSYREDAEAAAAEARRWTANVVTIFTPNATWDAVRPALQGAAIVVDMGHGNGFPSPYTTTLQPETQDGLGLNPPGATENNTTRYHGEAVLAREVRLAPSAVVILSHLCYSSGNSEPGQPDPSPEVARQRVDNFAAGWFAAGARAVIADAHFGSSAAYLATFFGSQQPVESAWRSVPGANANEQAFSSVRTPGTTGYLDPDPATGSYYRSLVVFPGLTTGDISGSFAPAQPLGPGPGGALLAYALSGGGGAFSPNGDGRQDTIAVAGRLTGPAVWQLTFRGPGGVPAATYGGTGDAFAASWDGTSAGIRVPDGGYGWDLTATDGWGNAGYVMGSVIVDTVAPAMAPPQKPGATTVFSPNGDRVADVLRLQLIASGANAFEAAVQDASGFPVRSLRVMAPAGTGELVWDGLTDAGGVAPDGRYSLSIVPLDEAGNAATGNPGCRGCVLRPLGGEELDDGLPTGRSIRADRPAELHPPAAGQRHLDGHRCGQPSGPHPPGLHPDGARCVRPRLGRAFGRRRSAAAGPLLRGGARNRRLPQRGNPGFGGDRRLPDRLQQRSSRSRWDDHGDGDLRRAAQVNAGADRRPAWPRRLEGEAHPARQRDLPGDCPALGGRCSGDAAAAGRRSGRGRRPQRVDPRPATALRRRRLPGRDRGAKLPPTRRVPR